MYHIFIPHYSSLSSSLLDLTDIKNSNNNQAHADSVMYIAYPVNIIIPMFVNDANAATL
jgi:hypothetical protein